MTRSDAENFAIIERASERVTFRLTYGRGEEPRVMSLDGIMGGNIPDARSKPLEDGTILESSGDWYFGMEQPEYSEATEVDWMQAWFRAAVTEAVHEVLEWFQVDGDLVLDPHGPYLAAIQAITGQAGTALLGLSQHPVVSTRTTPIVIWQKED